ncbi:MAG: plasmid maintenance system killer protein [Mogibacterium sp.]|nr:plasmid maintenance system killer protein [Mogibacterium sp.]
MRIIYKTKKFEKVCNNFSIAKKEYGDLMAHKIHEVIDYLRAANTVDLLVHSRIGGCHPLKGNRKGQYAFYLVHPQRLIFTVKKEEISVYCIEETARVEDIEDYH